MSKTTEHIEQMLQYLDLTTMASTLDGIVRSPRYQQLGILEILHEMVSSEFNMNNSKNTKALLRLARLGSSQVDHDKADYPPRRDSSSNSGPARRTFNLTVHQ
jgi:uncharacterized protein YjgD (DUF1641 family)